MSWIGDRSPMFHRIRFMQPPVNGHQVAESWRLGWGEKKSSMLVPDFSWMLLDSWMYGRFLMCSILVDWKYWKNGCGGPFLTFRRRWQRLASQLFASLGSSGAFLVAHFLCASLCTVRAISYVVGSMNGWYMKLYATHQQTASPKKQRVRHCCYWNLAAYSPRNPIYYQRDFNCEYAQISTHKSPNFANNSPLSEIEIIPTTPSKLPST